MKRPENMKKEEIRNIISLLLIVVFAIVFATGLVMVPFLQGILGTKDMISGSGTSPIEIVHTISGILMGLLSIIHIVLELKHKMQQREFMKAMKNPNRQLYRD